MSEENNKIVGGTRIPELDIMKLVGIVLVVVGHVTRMFTPQGLIPQADDTGIMDILTKVIYSFHMPLFVFVSGMTFALIATRRGNYHNIISFMRKKTMRLMIPYFQIDNSLVYQFWFILGYIAMIYRKYLNILFSILIIVVLGFIERASLLYALLGIYAIYLLSLRLTYLTRFTFINKVNSNIFGIYLFHPVIIYLFFCYLVGCPVLCS